MDPDADREPRPAGVVVARRAEDRRSGFHRSAHVLLTGPARGEQRHDLVADELVDEPVGLDDDPGRLAIEAVQERGERLGPDAFGHARRAADVGEHHRERDLRAAELTLEEREARRAVVRVLVPRRPTHQPHDRRADPTERGIALLAARRARDVAEDVPNPAEAAVVLAHEELAPELESLRIDRRCDGLGSHGPQDWPRQR